MPSPRMRPPENDRNRRTGIRRCFRRSISSLGYSRRTRKAKKRSLQCWHRKGETNARFTRYSTNVWHRERSTLSFPHCGQVSGEAMSCAHTPSSLPHHTYAAAASVAAPSPRAANCGAHSRIISASAINDLRKPVKLNGRICTRRRTEQHLVANRLGLARTALGVSSANRAITVESPDRIGIIARHLPQAGARQSRGPRGSRSPRPIEN